MAQVVGIHGIGKQYETGEQLARLQWVPALAGALTEAKRPDLVAGLEQRVTVASYGQLFRPPGDQVLSTLSAPPYAASDLRQPDERAWVDALYAAGSATDDSLASLANALARAPLSVQQMVLRLLQVPGFAGISERVLVGNLKQVTAYLGDPQVQEQVHGRVLDVITDDTTVLIGHSLGSVVAYQVLALGLAPQVRLLLTLGSPLGIPNIVYEKLQPAVLPNGRRLWPGDVERWVNVAEPGDFVAMVKLLEPLFADGPKSAGAEDVRIHSGWKAHDASRYLNTIQVGTVLGHFL